VVNLNKAITHWPDMLRVAGSLVTKQVRAYDLRRPVRRAGPQRHRLEPACDLIADHHGVHLDLASIPEDDPAVYRMIARGDTIGVFQVESRAQVSTLPQLQPACFDDLAIAASIIRPGPIQTGSKHPLLRRRRGEEPVTYPHPLAQRALEKTLGVALWQEQAMTPAIDCAGFSPGQATGCARRWPPSTPLRRSPSCAATSWTAWPPTASAGGAGGVRVGGPAVDAGPGRGVIEERFKVTYEISGVWRLLDRPGWWLAVTGL
jgi:hypothetical protein